MADDDFFFENAEEPQMISEVKAFERAGGGGVLTGMLTGMSAEELGRKRDSYTPEDRFRIAVDALSRRLKLPENDITQMLQKTEFIPSLKYKNSSAYILGYLASKGGKRITKDRVDYVLANYLPELADAGGVEPADVIRYARYWTTYLA